MKNILSFYFILTSLFSYAQWDHSTYRATSADGINWTRDTTLLFYPASVPKAVVDTNGKVFIYYIYIANINAMETIMVSSSTDGLNFSTPQPITITNNVTLNRFDPKPVLLKDGSIRIYYVDATTIPPKDVYSAVSNDGINFTEESGKRFEYNDITDPDVFIMDSLWVLFVPSINGMVRAVSNDEGFTFIQDTTFSWSPSSVFGTYKFDSVTYRTYYCNQGDIISATSTNGYDLIPDSGIRLTAQPNEILCDPSVIELNGEYIMYFKSQPEQSSGLTNKGVIPKMEFYPNPLSGNKELTVSIPRSNNSIFEIYNSIGELVFKQNLINVNTIINLKDLSIGFYSYRLSNSTNMPSEGGKLIVAE